MAKRSLSVHNEELRLGQGIALFAESDRGCVLVTHAQIEDKLGELLRKHFENASGERGAIIDALLGGRRSRTQMAPLSSFSTRARLARAVGIIDQRMYEALTAINALRVHCAHFPSQVLLSTERVETILHKLEPRQQREVIAAQSELAEMIEEGWHHSAARIGFICVATTIIDYLTNLPRKSRIT